MSEPAGEDPGWLPHLESLPPELAHQVINDLPLSTIFKVLRKSKSSHLESLILSHSFWGQVFETAAQFHHASFMFSVVEDVRDALWALPIGYDHYDQDLRRGDSKLHLLDRSGSTWDSPKPPTLGNLVRWMRGAIIVRLDHLRQIYGRSWLLEYHKDNFPEGSEELANDLGRLHLSVQSYLHKRDEIRKLKWRQINELIDLLEEYPLVFKRNTDPGQVVRSNHVHMIKNLKGHAGVMKNHDLKARRLRIDRKRWLFFDPVATFVPHDFLILYLVQTLETHAPDASLLPAVFFDELKTVRQTIEGHVATKGLEKAGSRKNNVDEMSQLTRWISSFPVENPDKVRKLAHANPSAGYPEAMLEDIKTAIYGLNHNYLLMSSYGRDWTAHHDPERMTAQNILRPESRRKQSRLFINGVDEYEMELFPAEMYRQRALFPRETTEIKWLNAFARAVTYMKDHVNPGSTPTGV